MRHARTPTFQLSGPTVHFLYCNRGETIIFLLGGGVFGEFAQPNFIIPCEVIGVRVKKFFFFWGGGGRSPARRAA